jgi:hypothetical protein
MSVHDLWRLSTEYSVIHAALIIAGFSPDETENHRESDLGHQCPGYTPAKTALCNALRSGRLECEKLIYENNEFDISEYIDVYRTLISVSDLDRFVRSRGVVCEFFERPSGAPSCSREGHPYFSRKLDAANRAWQAVTSDPTLLAGKSPKQALQRWLTENCLSLGLINKDGSPNRTGIEEICKVANWKPEGGATPTPTRQELLSPPTLRRIEAPSGFRRLNPPRETFSADLDDEIPF